jgi:MraZ protein
MRNKSMYIGQFYHTLDGKNRVFLPSKFRSKEKTFIITRGLDDCLYLYDLDGWDKVILKLENALVSDKAEERAFKRAILSGANEVRLDVQGRILLPQVLVDYAGIKTDVMIIGLGNRLEIWDKKRWDIYFAKEADISFKGMASKLEI